MSESAEILRRVAALLDQAGIPFMVAGSFASSVHGRPRTTQDLDIVIEVDRKTVTSFVRSLSKEEWYADPDAAIDAVLRHSIFNLVDMKTGWKVDLVVRKERPFSVEEFRRRAITDAMGVSVPMATAEDTIIAKLEWSKMSGGSERQRRDVASIVAARAGELDRDYIARWISALNLDDEWAVANGIDG
jgi:hypothetical protein